MRPAEFRPYVWLRYLHIFVRLGELSALMDLTIQCGGYASNPTERGAPFSEDTGWVITIPLFADNCLRQYPSRAHSATNERTNKHLRERSKTTADQFPSTLAAQRTSQARRRQKEAMVRPHRRQSERLNARVSFSKAHQATPAVAVPWTRFPPNSDVALLSNACPECMANNGEEL